MSGLLDHAKALRALGAAFYAEMEDRPERAADMLGQLLLRTARAHNVAAEKLEALARAQCTNAENPPLHPRRNPPA